jgi:hypothetical protein
MALHVAGDFVDAIDGVRYRMLLRKLGNIKFEIVGICYLWAALELNYRNPGSRKDP